MDIVLDGHAVLCVAVVVAVSLVASAEAGRSVAGTTVGTLTHVLVGDGGFRLGDKDGLEEVLIQSLVQTKPCGASECISSTSCVLSGEASREAIVVATTRNNGRSFSDGGLHGNHELLVCLATHHELIADSKSFFVSRVIALAATSVTQSEHNSTNWHLRMFQ